MALPPDDGRKPVASKKKSAPTGKQLRATVEKLEARLERTEAKAERWKSEARRLRTDAADLERRLKKANKRARTLAAVTPAPANRSRAREQVEEAPVLPEAAPSGDGPVQDGSAAPDETWTVVRLRAEARSRGLTGLSNRSKADLLAALR
jgi:chromosome segregation ATPase